MECGNRLRVGVRESVSECVVKTLACRGLSRLRVGPSKHWLCLSHTCPMHTFMKSRRQTPPCRESFYESGEGIRLPRERGWPLGKSGNFPGSPGNFHRWRSEGDAGKGTGQKMSWQSVPLTPIGFVLRAPDLANQFPSFLYFRRHSWEGPGGGSDKMGLEGKETDLSWHFLTFFFPSPFSGGTKRDELKGTNARNSQFFADFRRFLLIFAFPGNYSILEAQILAENRRKPQIFAENRRFLQKSVCPI